MSALWSSTPWSSSTSNGDLSAGNAKVSIVTVVFVMVRVVSVAVVIVASITKCYLNRKRQSSNTYTTPITDTPTTIIQDGSVEKFLDGIMKEKPIRFSPQHLVDCTNNYSEPLGSGGFGDVYKGVLHSGVRVAVKVLRTTLDKRAEEQFMAEVGTIGRTYHINLVELYGFCFDDAVKALVYEYMENGSLDRFLFDKNGTIEWEKLHEISIGTAKGIRYLHEECRQKIVHYDIKPGNVLLSASFVPKVADFGLAKFCDRDRTQVAITGGRGTPGYAAPEMWMPFPVTHKCDVYSFGMLLFEIVGRRRNLELSRDESEQWFPRWVWEKYEEGRLESVMSVSRIGERHRTKTEMMCKVALWCVQYHPEARPSMSSVVRMLEGDEEIMPPVNPFLYMAGYERGSGSQNKSTKASTSRDTINDTMSNSYLL